MTPRTLSPREVVAEAADWYDREYPGWWQRVDLGLLDMDDSAVCVAGQVIGYDERGQTGFTQILNRRDVPAVVLAACAGFRSAAAQGVRVEGAGFEGEPYVEAITRLHDAWRDQIKARFEEGRGVEP